MSTPIIPLELRKLVRQRAQGYCEYCQSSENITGIPCEIDHIWPRSAGGETESENLCLACSRCNSYKQAKTTAIDPITTESVPLFHPRQHDWQNHFGWIENGKRIIGKTPLGRATIEALRMNDPLIVSARGLWIQIGIHPPN